ncbi:MAG: hypothetical protein IJS96_03400 [Schwartzia sp.]|nr:hypothetical protein [Schwartzia sp. (in: firmicutes)]
MKHLHRIIALFVCGISTFTLLPQNNYLQEVSSPEQLTRRSWERTGGFLKAAMDNYKGLRDE